MTKAMDTQTDVRSRTAFEQMGCSRTAYRLVMSRNGGQMITPAAGSNAGSVDYIAYLDISLGAHLAHSVRTAAGLLADPLMLLDLLDGGPLRRIRLQHLPAGARKGHAVMSTTPGRTQQWEDNISRNFPDVVAAERLHLHSLTSGYVHHTCSAAFCRPVTAATTAKPTQCALSDPQPKEGWLHSIASAPTAADLQRCLRGALLARRSRLVSGCPASAA